ncbi:GTPase Era [Salinispira pacifica]|uniref:GTPase Era n=1 Tax=Salinispira pacifica TaxID=1307761 RepID=V5WKX5_9SPIO|nr:GTPase Era [Salinispira pacifica]AHC16194.1 GTP-binding protein Era [Salinispira pacifica]
MKKSAIIAIVGRPSAGKSTLMNALCGEKISIVSPVPQTTRNKIKGIMNDEAGQLIFMDTPGFHNSERKYNLEMRNLVSESLSDCDGILYVLDASRPPGEEEMQLIALLSGQKAPLVIAFNKTDIASPERLRELLEESPGSLPPGMEISAATGHGLEELKQALFSISPEGEALYPEDYYTDQDPEFRIAEIIRERAMMNARDELPHAMYVEIHDMEINEREEGKIPQLWIRASVVVETKSQVGLVVGKGGTGIKEIRVKSQKEIGRLFPYRIHLDLRVKTNPKWRRNDAVLRRLMK